MTYFQEIPTDRYVPQARIQQPVVCKDPPKTVVFTIGSIGFVIGLGLSVLPGGWLFGVPLMMSCFWLVSEVCFPQKPQYTPEQLKRRTELRAKYGLGPES